MFQIRHLAGRLLLLLTLSLMTAADVQAQSRTEKGKATFYSRRADGARTSSGIRLSNDSLVCAHRTHPFGTLLCVRNLRNGREVVVKVIDRGPHTRGRIVDLSREAADRIAMVSDGVADVELTVVGSAPLYNPPATAKADSAHKAKKTRKARKATKVKKGRKAHKVAKGKKRRR